MHGPMMAEIWGTTPEEMLFSKKIFPIAVVTESPSWIRAPTES